MKVIDLLNKIANGEEVPKKIKYRKCIFEYEEKYKEYFTKNGIIPTTFDTNGIFRNIFLDYNNCLNEEVEIIEEREMCHRCGKYPSEYNQTYCEFCLGISEEDKKIERLSKNDIHWSSEIPVIDKVNEIIDKINKMKEK